MRNVTVTISPSVSLTVLLAILKLIGAAQMRWLWVFSPMWIPILLAVVFAGLVGFVALFTFLFKERSRDRRNW